MLRRSLSVGLAFLVWLAANAGRPESTRAQEPPATFPARVEQVTVDVVVADKKGGAITGLRQEDLEVYENGVRQTIVSFDAVEVAAAPAEAPVRPSRVSTNAARDAQRGRTFVIVFDDVHLTASTALQARAAVASFLKTGTREGDRVTLVAPGGGTRWTARMEAGRDQMIDLVKRLQGRYVPDTDRARLSEYEAMRIHVFRDEMVMNRVQRRFETAGVPTMRELGQNRTAIRGVEEPTITTRAAEVYFEATSRNRISLDATLRSINSLVGLKGRKSLILVSNGFIYDPNLNEFKRIIEASRRASTAIYFVNGRGLTGLPTSLTADLSAPLPAQDIGFAFSEAFEESEGSESVAADSGGFTVRDTNDLASGFKRIADETRAYYLIGYNPTNTARDGLFRKIQVKVPARKGVQVRARKGYYAPSDQNPAPSPKQGADAAFQEALDAPYEVDDIPLRMTHFVREETLLDKARVFVSAEVDVRSLGFEETEGLSTGALHYLIVLAHRETGETFQYDQTVELKIPPAEREELVRTWLPIVREFELGPGKYQAKLVVRDKGTGRVGTVVHEISVPDLSSFRVSTPILSDHRETAQDGAPGDRLAILARRDFPQGGSLFCQLEVYRAVRLEDSNRPRVTMGYEVRTSAGAVYTRDPPSLIAPTPQGTLSRLIGFSLEAATPGDYELVLRVKDELSGKALELREPFTVSEPLPAPPAPNGK
jgi:VWFA-related protein